MNGKDGINQRKISKLHQFSRTAMAILTVCALAAGLLILFTVSGVFGIRARVVLSDSMKATDFAAGDLIFCEQIDPADLREGDIITFRSVSPESYGMEITHKIRACVTDANGKPGFLTFGTTTGETDDTVVTYSHVLGRYCFALPKAGYVFGFLRSIPGYLLCVLLPFLVLIGLRCAEIIGILRRRPEEKPDAVQSEERD